VRTRGRASRGKDNRAAKRCVPLAAGRRPHLADAVDDAERGRARLGRGGAGRGGAGRSGAGGGGERSKGVHGSARRRGAAWRGGAQCAAAARLRRRSSTGPGRKPTAAAMAGNSSRWMMPMSGSCARSAGPAASSARCAIWREGAGRRVRHGRGWRSREGRAAPPRVRTANSVPPARPSLPKPPAPPAARTPRTPRPRDRRRGARRTRSGKTAPRRR
jgi:hypothetical protein